MKRLILLSIAALAGCATSPTKVVEVAKPVLVPEVVTRFVPVPTELSADCYDEPAKEQTYAEAKRLAIVRHRALTECTARMKRIRGLEAK